MVKSKETCVQSKREEKGILLQSDTKQFKQYFYKVFSKKFVLLLKGIITKEFPG